MRWTGLLVLLLVLTPPSWSQISDDRRIVPGVRIGKWSLEMPIDEMLRMNGPVSTRASVFSDLVPNLSWYAWDALHLGAATRDPRKIEYLAISVGSAYTTQKGIGIRASRKAVLAAYGDPTAETDLSVGERIVTILVYDGAGLAFFLHSDSVQVVLIFRPGSSRDFLPDC